MPNHEKIEALLSAIEKGAPSKKVVALAAKARKAGAGKKPATNALGKAKQAIPVLKAAKAASVQAKPVAVKVMSGADVIAALTGMAHAAGASVANQATAAAALQAEKTKVKNPATKISGMAAGGGGSHPKEFPLKDDEFRIRFYVDMYGMYDRTGEGVMYGVDVVFSRDFFGKAPCDAWTPACVRFEAVGFSKSDVSYLASLGIKPSAWEKRALGSMMQEPWTIFEKIEFSGSAGEARDAWFSANGYWEPLGDGSADAAFAKHFKKNKIAPAH